MDKSTMESLNRIALLEDITSNQETIEAINEAYEGKNMIGPFNSSSELFAHLDKDNKDE